MKFPREVYMIRHNLTGRMYIGSSCRCAERISKHLQALRRGKHTVEDFQRDYNEYGDDFSIVILDTINDLNERHKEYEYMKKYNSYTRGIGYNYKDNTKPKSKIEPDVIKEVYIDLIAELMQKTDDIVLLDFIYATLKKSLKIKSKEEQLAMLEEAEE